MSSSKPSTPANHYRRTAEIFLLVCDLAGPARRDALERACAGDRALRADVEELLVFHDGAPGRPHEKSRR